mmetsp:Transcript_43283/g.49112  ORF Transcript_43283/g.49112 Transcript_43283/m.49112 type:complete len:91 (+) Transcript_43283:433-705(+)
MAPTACCVPNIALQIHAVAEKRKTNRMANRTDDFESNRCPDKNFGSKLGKIIQITTTNNTNPVTNKTQSDETEDDSNPNISDIISGIFSK